MNKVKTRSFRALNRKFNGRKSSILCVLLHKLALSLGHGISEAYNIEHTIPKPIVSSKVPLHMPCRAVSPSKDSSARNHV